MYVCVRCKNNLYPSVFFSRMYNRRLDLVFRCLKKNKKLTAAFSVGLQTLSSFAMSKQCETGRARFLSRVQLNCKIYVQPSISTPFFLLLQTYTFQLSPNFIAELCITFFF